MNTGDNGDTNNLEDIKRSMIQFINSFILANELSELGYLWDDFRRDVWDNNENYILEIIQHYTSNSPPADDLDNELHDSLNRMFDFETTRKIFLLAIKYENADHSLQLIKDYLDFAKICNRGTDIYLNLTISFDFESEPELVSVPEKRKLKINFQTLLVKILRDIKDIYATPPVFWSPMHYEESLPFRIIQEACINRLVAVSCNEIRKGNDGCVINLINYFHSIYSLEESCNIFLFFSRLPISIQKQYFGIPDNLNTFFIYLLQFCIHLDTFERPLNIFLNHNSPYISSILVSIDMVWEILLSTDFDYVNNILDELTDEHEKNWIKNCQYSSIIKRCPCITKHRNRLKLKSLPVPSILTFSKTIENNRVANYQRSLALISILFDNTFKNLEDFSRIYDNFRYTRSYISYIKSYFCPDVNPVNINRQRISGRNAAFLNVILLIKKNILLVFASELIKYPPLNSCNNFNIDNFFSLLYDTKDESLLYLLNKNEIHHTPQNIDDELFRDKKRSPNKSKGEDLFNVMEDFPLLEHISEVIERIRKVYSIILHINTEYLEELNNFQNIRNNSRNEYIRYYVNPNKIYASAIIRNMLIYDYNVELYPLLINFLRFIDVSTISNEIKLNYILYTIECLINNQQYLYYIVDIFATYNKYKDSKNNPMVKSTYEQMTKLLEGFFQKFLKSLEAVYNNIVINRLIQS